jgi:hypothetical protein
MGSLGSVGNTILPNDCNHVSKGKFKKETTNDPKNYISPNQTNILDQIKEVGAADEQL